MTNKVTRRVNWWSHCVTSPAPAMEEGGVAQLAQLHGDGRLKNTGARTRIGCQKPSPAFPNGSTQKGLAELPRTRWTSIPAVGRLDLDWTDRGVVRADRHLRGWHRRCRQQMEGEP